MPALYSGDTNRKPKPSVTEFSLYNMASMLAAVATGYDVRMSNVSPVHPKLQPQIFSEQDPNGVGDSPAAHGLYVESSELVVSERVAYPHNTYHGPTKHTR